MKNPTIHQWLKTIPDRATRSAALRNHAKKFKAQGVIRSESFGGAMMSAFGWTGTPEGAMFWSRLGTTHKPTINDALQS